MEITIAIALGLALYVSHYSRRKLPNGERPATPFVCKPGCGCGRPLEHGGVE